MATLTSSTIADTYEMLLKLETEDLAADAVAKYIEDGKGVDSALSISTTRVGILNKIPTTVLQVSGSFSTVDEMTGSLHKNPYLAREFTGSNFQPYITTINLYQKGDYDTPAIIATLPKPIRKSKKIATTFRIILDM